jgi:hypothetical protein
MLLFVLALVFLGWSIGRTQWIHYWDYSTSRFPDFTDLDIAEVNTAIALQQIAEEGIKVRVIIEKEATEIK